MKFQEEKLNFAQSKRYKSGYAEASGAFYY